MEPIVPGLSGATLTCRKATEHGYHGADPDLGDQLSSMVCGEHPPTSFGAEFRRSVSGCVYHQHPQIVWRMNHTDSPTLCTAP